MTDNVTLSNLTTLTNETGAVETINNNSATIVTAFDNVLFTNGGEGQGQTMQVDLDMNSNRIVNLPAPITVQEPVRLADVSNLIAGGTITVEGVPTGGTTNQVLAKSSNSNFATQWIGPLSGVINDGASGQVAYYSADGDTISGDGNLTIANGAITLGTSGSQGSVTLNGSTSGTLTIAPAAVAGTNTITLPAGTTDFSSTSGVLQQASTGAAITVADLSSSDLSDGTTGSGNIVLASSPTITTPSIAGAALSGTISGTPTITGSNFIGLTSLVQADANTLVGNSTASTANIGSFTIGSLMIKNTPVSADQLLIADSANSGQLSYITAGSLTSTATGGAAYISGRYYTPYQGSFAENLYFNNNTIYFLPFMVPSSVTIVNIGYNVYTGNLGSGSSTTILAGLYYLNGSNLSLLDKTASNITVSSYPSFAGGALFNTTDTLMPGKLYFLAYFSSNSNAVIGVGGNGTVSNYGRLLGDTTPLNVLTPQPYAGLSYAHGSMISTVALSSTSPCAIVPAGAFEVN